MKATAVYLSFLILGFVILITPVNSQPAVFSGAAEDQRLSNAANWRSSAADLDAARQITFAPRSTTLERPAILDGMFASQGKSIDVQDFSPAGATLVTEPGLEIRVVSVSVGQTRGQNPTSPGIMQVGEGSQVVTVARNNGRLMVGTEAPGALILQPDSLLRFGRIHLGEKGQLALIAGPDGFPLVEQWQNQDRDAEFRFDGRLIVNLTQFNGTGTYRLLTSGLPVLQGRLAKWLEDEGDSAVGKGSGVHGDGVFEVTGGNDWKWTLLLTDGGRVLRLRLEN